MIQACACYLFLLHSFKKYKSILDPPWTAFVSTLIIFFVLAAPNIFRLLSRKIAGYEDTETETEIATEIILLVWFHHIYGLERNVNESVFIGYSFVVFWFRTNETTFIVRNFILVASLGSVLRSFTSVIYISNPYFAHTWYNALRMLEWGLCLSVVLKNILDSLEIDSVCLFFSFSVPFLFPIMTPCGEWFEPETQYMLPFMWITENSFREHFFNSKGAAVAGLEAQNNCPLQVSPEESQKSEQESVLQSSQIEIKDCGTMDESTGDPIVTQ